MKSDGCRELLFGCQGVINGCMKNFELKYRVPACQWLLYRIGWYSFDGTGKLKRVGNVDLSLKENAQKGGAKAYALVHNMGANEYCMELPSGSWA